jgi:RNA-directed DNA polymerase
VTDSGSETYEKIIDYPNIHRAYLDARQCKRYRSSILRFGYDLERNLWQIKNDLKNGTYRHGSYREFIVADSKKRHIKAAPFRDRVIHHALCNIIEPILDKTFIYDSYACRKGKGTHAAVRRLEKFIRSMQNVAVREREREREQCSANFLPEMRYFQIF